MVKLRMLQPLNGWCVDGRGFHRHYKLTELLLAMREKKAFNNQPTKIFCPKCDREQIFYNFHEGLDDNGLEVFHCKCGTESKWNFDAPAPLLVDHHFDENIKKSYGFLEI